MQFLDNIRKAKPTRSTSEKVLTSLGILMLGIVLEVLAKALEAHYTSLPDILARVERFLDFHNFLLELAVWFLIAICIAVYSRTPLRAGINVFSFFVGILISLYMYSYIATGAFPSNIELSWLIITIFSPVFGYICWYAKGRGAAAVFVSAFALAFLFNCAFGYGWSYISVKRWLSVLVYVIGVWVLKKKVRETEIMVGLSVILAMLFNRFLPMT